jgi:hypothetical protein
MLRKDDSLDVLDGDACGAAREFVSCLIEPEAIRSILQDLYLPIRSAPTREPPEALFELA